MRYLNIVTPKIAYKYATVTDVPILKGIKSDVAVLKNCRNAMWKYYKNCKKCCDILITSDK